MRREGIAVAGNLLVDYVKEIASYPAPGQLANILTLERSVGGCVPNTLLDLHAIDSAMPLSALGCVGADENGRYVLDRLSQAGVDTSGVKTLEGVSTSFSDAMSARDTGERTFFHCRGANAAFGPEHAPTDALRCRILHVGYMLLLDRFDAPDAEYGTVLARYLRGAREQGMLTCVDAVSDSCGQFARVVLPALRYCDYAIMNELEGCAAFGWAARDENGRLLVDNVRKALDAFIAAGVSRRAVLHCPEAGFCMDRDTGFCVVPSFELPKGYVKGSVGAGDAFCAGCLYAINRGLSAEEMLSYGAAAAAASLSAPDAVSGMKTALELQKMILSWEKKRYETI